MIASSSTTFNLFGCCQAVQRGDGCVPAAVPMVAGASEGAGSKSGKEDLDPRLLTVLRSPAMLGRWLQFVGGEEFTALYPTLKGMRLGELLQVDCSGLARLGAQPRVAVRLFEELARLRQVVVKDTRPPQWLQPLLSQVAPRPGSAGGAMKPRPPMRPQSGAISARATSRKNLEL